MGERSVIIDPAKMRKWMYEKEFSGAYVSQLLGRSYNYISSVLSTRRMSLTTYRLLKKEFGLTDSEILKEENTEPAPRVPLFLRRASGKAGPRQVLAPSQRHGDVQRVCQNPGRAGG